LVKGNEFVILKALDRRRIDELLELSKSYRVEENLDADDDDSLGDRPEIININVLRPDGEDGARLNASVVEGFDDGLDAPKPISLGRGDSSEGPPLLHGVVNLRKAPDFWVQGQSSFSSTDAQNAWRGPKTLMSACSVTAELSTIHSAEYYLDELGLNKLTLCCPDGPTTSHNEDSLVRMRWL
jgi:hypothetical protein